jgi:hypothetical protein
VESEAEQLARRDRLMRHAAAQMTPQERVVRAQEMHEQAMRQLQSNPEAFERFMRRNLSQRAAKPYDQP